MEKEPGRSMFFIAYLLLSCPENILLGEGEKENHVYNCFTMSKLLSQFSKASGQ